MESSYRNIVITGFMGTGKTSVGQEVARCLGWEFIDMDDVIQSQAGKTIPEIFAEDGEAAFREMEAALCRELAERSQVVISTGGGALVPDANRRVMSRHGLVVCLTADVEEIWWRLQKATDRPMLYANDRRARMEELLAERAPAYNRIPHHVDTTHTPVEEAARQIIRLWETDRRVIAVHAPEGDYRIHLGRGLLAETGELLRQAGLCGGIGLVSDAIVAPLYADLIECSLRDAGFAVARCVLPAGEEHKTLDTVRILYDCFVEAGLARDSAVVALGGGVIGDMAGFAAATYMRGIAFVPVPTTLLAIVDSSVGGKVAVDHSGGKNLIGAFKQPAVVVADLDVLATLPPEEYRAGLAEMIKAGIIASPPLFAHLEAGGSGDALWPIAEAILVKVEVVEEDPYEQDRRAVLNLGHTFAHAIELLSGFRLRHGEAVSVGLVAAARTAEALGVAEAGLAERITACLRRHGLPTALPDYAPEACWEAMSGDKKKHGGRLRFVLPRAIGEIIITKDVPREVVCDVLAAMRTGEGA